jgi:hypothetical protein
MTKASPRRTGHDRRAAIELGRARFLSFMTVYAIPRYHHADWPRRFRIALHRTLATCHGVTFRASESSAEASWAEGVADVAAIQQVAARIRCQFVPPVPDERLAQDSAIV